MNRQQLYYLHKTTSTLNAEKQIMLARSHNLLTIALVLTGTFLLTSDTGFGQTFVIEPAPTRYVTAYRGSYYAYPPVVAVPTTYTAYYAPRSQPKAVGLGQ